MNQITLIVKLLESPKQSFFEANICVTEALAEFTTKYKKTVLKKNIVQISAWGDQGKNLATSYKSGDFLIVEGLISLRSIYLENKKTLIAPKLVELTAINFYPYYLSNTSNNLKTTLAKENENLNNEVLPF